MSSKLAGCQLFCTNGQMQLCSTIMKQVIIQRWKTILVVRIINSALCVDLKKCVDFVMIRSIFSKHDTLHLRELY